MAVWRASATAAAGCDGTDPAIARPRLRRPSTPRAHSTGTITAIAKVDLPKQAGRHRVEVPIVLTNEEDVIVCRVTLVGQLERQQAA